MKYNVFMGNDLDSLPTEIQEKKCQYSLNLIAEHEVFRRRDALIPASGIGLPNGYTKIITVDSFSMNQGGYVVGYLVADGSGNMKIIMYAGTKTISIDVDEKIPKVTNLSYTRLIFASTKTGFLVAIKMDYLRVINLYQFVVNRGVIELPTSNEKIAYPQDAASIIQTMTSSINEDILFTAGDGGTIILHKINYTANTFIVSSLTLKQVLTVFKEYGNPKALIQLSESMLVGTTKNILKITSKVISGTTSYQLSLALAGVGIGNDKSWYLLQNSLFCASSLGFFKFNIGLVDNQGSVYIKNINSSEDYRVKGLDSIAHWITNASIKMFRSGSKQEMVEVYFDTKENSTLISISDILISKNIAFKSFLTESDPSKDFRFRFLFNMHTDGVFPIKRKSEIMATSSFKRIALFPSLASWINTGTGADDGVYKNMAFLNKAYFQKISKPLAQELHNEELYLLHDDTGFTYCQVKDGKSDIFPSRIINSDGTITVNRDEIPYPIVLVGPAVGDVSSAKSAQVQFAVGYQNSDGLVYREEIAQYNEKYLSILIGTINNRYPFSYSYNSSFDVSIDYLRSMKQSNIVRALSAKMSIATSVIFVTSSLVVDILFGITAPEGKLSGRHSNVS